MKENICTILLNRTLNKETDDAPIGTVAGDNYYINVKNGLKKWEQYIDIATTRTDDPENGFFIDSYLYQKIRDDQEYQVVYTDMFLVKDTTSQYGNDYVPLCFDGTYDGSRRFKQEQLNEGIFTDNGRQTPVESKYGVRNEGGDQLIVTCTANGNYLIRYVAKNIQYVLTYIVSGVNGNYRTNICFVKLDNFKTHIENDFDEYGLYLYGSEYYGFFWRLRGNQLNPAINNIIYNVLNEERFDTEFNIYDSNGVTKMPYNLNPKLFKEGIYYYTTNTARGDAIVELYPLYFNKDVSLNYVAPEEQNPDKKYLIHASSKIYNQNSYEVYKHNYYIPSNQEDTKTLISSVTGQFRIIESFPCDFDRFNIKISPMWDSELDANPVAIEMQCVVKYRDTVQDDENITYVYHKEYEAGHIKFICEKKNNDETFDISGKKKLNLLRSEQEFFLNDDLFRISVVQSVQVTVTPIMIFGPLYNLSRVINIETDKINTNSVEMKTYKYFYTDKKITLTYNIEQYIDSNATIYNDSEDSEHCPHCYITKLSDFINNDYKTDKQHEITQISESLLSSVYNTVSIPVAQVSGEENGNKIYDGYIIPSEIYILEFVVYIYYLDTFIKRSIFRIMHTNDMFNDAFMNGKMEYSNGDVIEDVEDFKVLNLNPDITRYLNVTIQDGTYKYNYSNTLESVVYLTSREMDVDQQKNIEKKIKLVKPTFTNTEYTASSEEEQQYTDTQNAAKFQIICGPDKENLVLPYSFDLYNNYTNTDQDYKYQYYNGNDVAGQNEYTITYKQKYNKIVYNQQDWDWGQPKPEIIVDYQDISLLQFGYENPLSNRLGVIFNSNPSLSSLGAFNMSTYGWDDDSNKFLSYMYTHGDFDGTELETKWVLIPQSSGTQDYMSLFRQIKKTTPIYDNSFIPMYICGMQYGTADNRDGDGRLINYTNYISNYYSIRKEDIPNMSRNLYDFYYPTMGGFGTMKNKYSGIPGNKDNRPAYYNDFIGQFIWNSTNSQQQTGIWFCLSEGHLYLKTSFKDTWPEIKSGNLAHVLSAKLSQYYFRREYNKDIVKEMQYIHNHELFDPQNMDLYLLELSEAGETKSVDISLKIFSYLKYNDSKKVDLCVVKRTIGLEDKLELYRLINLNDYIKYGDDQNKYLLQSKSDNLIKGLEGDESNNKKDSIVNNLFFRTYSIQSDNVPNSTDSKEIIDIIDNIIPNKSSITDSFIHDITNPNDINIVTDKNDLNKFSLLFKYDNTAQSVVNINIGENGKKSLCVYPDGQFDVILDSREPSKEVYFCKHGEYQLEKSKPNKIIYKCLCDHYQDIKGTANYAFIKKSTDESTRDLTCTVQPSIKYFDENTQEITFWNENKHNTLIANNIQGLVARTFYDQAKGSIVVHMTNIFRNAIHPI